MKRLFIIWISAVLVISAGAETVFTCTSDGDKNQTKDGFTITLAQGSNTQNEPVYKPKTEYYDAEMRLYLNNTITITGGTMTNVQLVCAKSSSDKPYSELTASPGTLTSGGTSANAKDWKVDTWTGNTTKVVFTLSGKGQRILQKVVINGGEVIIEPEEPEPLPTEADLKTDYNYSEPTVIQVPDTQFYKKEYAFIANNILVHCTKGSTLRENKKEGEEYPAYFNCEENEQLSFTATGAIQKIEIDGYLRKAFSATCDHGTMTTKASEDHEVELDNVLTISNINTKSVTLKCDKNIKCFEVRVYFKESSSVLEGVESQESGVKKILQDGQVVIIRDNKRYTLLGNEN